MSNPLGRRTVLLAAGLVGAAGPLAAAAEKPKEREGKHHEGGGPEEDVTPTEDLMREHGVLRRVLLVYDELARRLEGRAAFPAPALAEAAALVRKMIEDYHEKLEETFVFPRLEKAKKEVALVATLRRQHQVGRQLTEGFLAAAKGSLAAEADRRKLAGDLRAFVRMYAPHAAWEDTVVFPAFRESIGPRAFHELGEAFEDEETKRLGPHGFEKAVAEVGTIEESLGLHDLALFTPGAESPPR